jgi:hypothetical protein
MIYLTLLKAFAYSGLLCQICLPNPVVLLEIRDGLLGFSDTAVEMSEESLSEKSAILVICSLGGFCQNPYKKGSRVHLEASE